MEFQKLQTAFTLCEIQYRTWANIVDYIL